MSVLRSFTHAAGSQSCVTLFSVNSYLFYKFLYLHFSAFREALLENFNWRMCPLKHGPMWMQTLLLHNTVFFTALAAGVFQIVETPEMLLMIVQIIAFVHSEPKPVWKIIPKKNWMPKQFLLLNLFFAFHDETKVLKRAIFNFFFFCLEQNNNPEQKNCHLPKANSAPNN